MAERDEAIGSEQAAQDIMLQKVQADLSGPRALKEPGSPDWCWQTIGLLQQQWEFFEASSGRYLQSLEEASAHKVWEVVPEDKPFGSKENMVAVLEIGDEKAALDRLKRDALKAVALHPQEGAGRDRKRLLLARIARDHPDILERVKQGEFRSAPEAARAAGIQIAKRQRTVTLSDKVDRVADVLSKHYSPEQLDELARLILESRRAT